MPGTTGLTHCGQLREWKDLGWAIVSDGEGGLLFEWSCPECGVILRNDPFAFPKDVPPQRSSRGRRSALRAL